MHTNETDRVKAVKALEIMGSTAEPELDRLARLAGHVAHADYAHVCFIDDKHQFAKAMSGVVLPRFTTRDDSICIQTVIADAPILIEDLASSPWSSARNAHRHSGLASYVGVPVRLENGQIVGAVAALSFERGLLSPRRLAALEECSNLVTRELEIRKAASDEIRRSGVPVARLAEGTTDVVRTIARNHLNVLKAVSDGVIVVRGDGMINFVNPAAEKILGRSGASMIGSTFAAALNVSAFGEPLPEQDCPVRASLLNRKDQLARRAYYADAERNPIRVECAISPVNARSNAIGAVVVFRRISSLAIPNGVELRNTLREVSKLKEQIARLETAHHGAVSLSRADKTGPGADQLSFDQLLELIRDEQTHQATRMNALVGAGGTAMHGSTELVGFRSNSLHQRQPCENSVADRAVT